MLLLDCKMPVPEGTRYSRHKQKSNTYLYYRERSYHENGKKKHVMHCIGKIYPDPDNEFGNNNECLAPNETFFKLQGKPVPPSMQTRSQGRPRKAKIRPAASEGEKSILGYSLACHAVLRDLGITELLIKYWGEHIANEIIAVSSFFSAGCPGGLSNIDDYTSDNIFFIDGVIDSNRLSKLYNEVDEVSKYGFFEDWIDKCKANNDCICYDVTSISTYSEELKTADYGYNRDGENELKQENLGLFCRIKDKMPLFYDEYDGSVNDFSNLTEVIEKARNVGLTGDLTLVFDGGFAVGSVIDHKFLREFDLIFGAPLSFCINIKDQVLEWISSSEYGSKTFFNGTDFYRYYETDFQVGQTKLRLIFYKSPSRQYSSEQTLGMKYAQYDEEISSKKKISPDEERKYSYFFDIERDSKGNFTYTLDELEFSKKLKLCGAFALFTTRYDLSAQEVLLTYRGRDSVEKLFEVIKNKILHERLRTGKDPSTRGKMFFTFLGLIIRTEIDRRIRPFLRKEKFGYDSAVARLNRITIYKYQDKWRLAGASTRKRKALAKLLNLPLEYFDQS